MTLKNLIINTTKVSNKQDNIANDKTETKHKEEVRQNNPNEQFKI